MMKRFFVRLIKGYRNGLSSMHPPCCRYTPTCSQYALEAVETHGAFKGVMLSLWRIIRCNPFSRGGYDPVPPITKKEREK